MSYEAFFLLMDLFPLAVTLGLFKLFDWWDRRKPPERRDAWGPWGFLLPASALGLGSMLFPLVSTLFLWSGQQPLHALTLAHLTLLAGQAVFFAFAIAWSFRGHQRRLEGGAGRGLEARHETSE